MLQGTISGMLLVAVFAAVAFAGVLAAVRLYRGTRSSEGRPPAGTGADTQGMTGAPAQAEGPAHV